MKTVKVFTNCVFFVVILIHEGLHYIGYVVSGSKPRGIIVGRNPTYVLPEEPTLIFVFPWSSDFVFNGGCVPVQDATTRQSIVSDVFAVGGTVLLLITISGGIGWIVGLWQLGVLVFILSFSFFLHIGVGKEDLENIAWGIRRLKTMD